MEGHWNINGSIRPMSGNMWLIKGILRSYGFDYADCAYADGVLNIWCDHGSDECLPDDFSNEIAPLLKNGELYAVDDTDYIYYRYTFSDEHYTAVNGERFIYYPGLEEKFAEALPDEAIHYIQGKHGFCGKLAAFQALDEKTVCCSSCRSQFSKAEVKGYDYCPKCGEKIRKKKQ